MASSGEEIEVAPGNACEERVPPTLKCCASAAFGAETTGASGAVTKGAGTNFLCNVPVPVLGSLTGLLGDRGLFCAVSLPDEFADFW